MIDPITSYILEAVMKDETELTLSLVDSNPLKLKSYIESTYKKELKIIIDKLEKKFGEKVDVYYTFTDTTIDIHQAYALDLDYYLVDNKLNYPIAWSNRKRLPVCFVISPPGYKIYGKKGRHIIDEGIYFAPKEKNAKVKYSYRKKVNDIRWGILFKEAMRVIK